MPLVKMPIFFSHKTLQRYLVREWLYTFLPSLACFEFLIFLGFAIQLLHKGLDIIALRELILHLFIQAFPYSIPSALLTATAMTYGRMSADREIIAIQASGIRIYKMITPILAMGIIFSLITLALSSEILPRSCYKMIVLQERAINNILTGSLATFQKKLDLHPYQIYIGSVENNVNKDIAVIEYANDYVINVILAEEGFIKVNEAENKIFLTLRRGEFIKPNYKKIGEAPRLGEFNETTFEISLKEKKRDSSTKYMTIFQLCKDNKKLKKVIRDAKISSNSQRHNNKLAIEFAACKEEYDDLSRKRKMLMIELEQSNENLIRQRSKIDGFENENKIAKNYILVSNENLIRLKKQNKISPSINEDRDKKIMQIKETIEREKQRIYTIEQNTATAKKIQNDEMKNITSLSQSISKIDAQQEILLKKSAIIEDDLEIIDKEESIRENDITIHRRASQSLSCLVFIIIGIPLGIKLRSGNLMVGLGASFMIILFLYYPLAVTGIALTKNTSVPVIPILWGADIILFLGGMFIFRKLLIK
ncbi:MAG: LptF/LptG family permease [Candidatus Jettenia sp.]|nr:LptF/LptG family permease [Candidatus Jettenia sp.]